MIVRKVNTSGVITLFAGTVDSCGFGGDGGSATAPGAYLAYPQSVATDAAGNVYIADTNNWRIRKVDTGGNLSTVAGDGGCSFDGDGPATSHALCYPAAVAVDTSGNLYIADYDNYLIRKVDTSDNMTTIAGNGSYCYSYSSCGDGGPATSATMTYPAGVAVDHAGNVYFSDLYNWRVREINTAGIIDTYAGNGTAGFEGDGGPATQTSLYYPEQVTVDSAGDVIIADAANQRIRLVDGQGLIHTIAGNGSYGYGVVDEGILATTAEVANPYGIGVDSSGNIYVGDTGNNLVRSVNAMAILNTSRTNVVFNVQSSGTTSGAQQVTLTSAGPLAISSITTTGPFSEADDCGGGPPAGTSCVMNIVFAPTSSGVFTGSVTIADNGFFNSSVVIELTGYSSAVTVTPTSLAFPQTTVGSTSSAKTVKLTNKAANPLTMGTVSTTGDFIVSGSTCTGMILHNITCLISVEFKPTQNGQRSGSLVIKDSDGSSPQLVSLSGFGLGAALTPATTTFTSQLDGTQSAAKIIVLTNKTSAAMTGIGAATFTGSNPSDFIVQSTTCGSSLAGNGSCSYSVAFAPTAMGAESATLSVSDSYGTQTATLKGTGTSVLVSAKSVSFSKVSVGVTSADKPVTVTNASTVTPLNITSIVIAGTDPGDFAIDTLNPANTCPVGGGSVSPSSSCTIEVNFTPSTTGTRTATLQINDNGAGPGSQQTVVLTGSGK
jgi:trimeric autotransporter adhesin